MGVINVTPDSFSDGGDFADPSRAAAHARQMAVQGADLVDLGGESTRPGSRPVSQDEELARLLPVVESLGAGFPLPLSVDTSKAPVARACLERGFSVVNDVTAGQADPQILEVAAEFGAYVILMHMQGTPRTMQDSPSYGDVVEEVCGFLAGRARAALAAGVPRDRVLLDPGIGFGKALEHNLALLQAVPRIRALGYPVVVGASRKSMFKGLLGLEDPKARDRASADLTAVLAFLGADVVRVHEVPQNLEAARVGDAVRRGGRPPTTTA
jgi:dihydropteroate synthase